MITSPQGVPRRSRSVTRERVNITIWKGTTMEKTHRRYKSLVAVLFTRVIYQANMEVQSRMTTTDPTVITTVQRTDSRKLYFSMALAKFSRATQVFSEGSLKGSRLIKAFFLKELMRTIKSGAT